MNDLSLQEKLEALPAQPGVYQFKSADGKIIYIGKAQNLRMRVRQYFQNSRTPDPRIDVMVSKIKDVELTVTDNEIEALILEANLIKKNKPRYNVLLKDDKSYPFIAITNEPYPRIIVTRRKVPGYRFFGPYTDIRSMRLSLKTIQDIFFIRSCTYELTESSIAKNKYKVCLDYHIKKCEGPCEGYVSREHYRACIDQAANVLKGKIRQVEEYLTKEMNAFAEAKKYEHAAALRDRIQTLHVYCEKQKIIDSKEANRDIIALVSKNDDACAVIFTVREGAMIGSRHLYLTNVSHESYCSMLETVLEQYYLDQDDIPPELLLSDELENKEIICRWLKNRSGSDIAVDIPKGGEKAKLIALVRANAQFWLDELELSKMKQKDFTPNSLHALQRDLRMKKLPKRIECFDISNIQGSDTVASMAVFVDGKPKKSEYRKYAIRSVVGENDFASMKEVVHRRYSKILDENKTIPDMILIDGGKGQLSGVVEILLELGLEDIPVYALAKRLEEIYLPNQNDPIQLPRTSSGLRILQSIRDEAHRFAVSYHRIKRSKRIIQTELEQIKGVGKKNAEKLLEAFGSFQGVKNATETELSRICGPSIAKQISEYFRESIRSEEQQGEVQSI